MMNQTKEKFTSTSTFKKVIVIFGYFTSLFGGMFAAIVAVYNYKNYIHPYEFTLCCASFGLVAGLYFAKLLKPYIILNKTMLSNYSNLTIQFSIGFIGGFMLLGYYFNSTISSQLKCDEFSVLKTEHHNGGFRQPERNILYVDIEGKIETILCSRDFWSGVSIGQKVKLCIYNSPIGFDNLVLTDDK